MRFVLAVLILLVLTVNVKSPVIDAHLTRGDFFDQLMYKEYPDYWFWPEKTRLAFRREFNNAKNKHYWFPDTFDKPVVTKATIRP